MSEIPKHYTDQLRLYGTRHEMPESRYLRAILVGDLREAMNCADDAFVLLLGPLALYCREHLSTWAWGSAKLVDEWVHHGGVDQEAF